MDPILEPILRAGWVGAAVFLTYTMGKLADKWLVARISQRTPDNGHRSQLETERHVSLAHSMTALGDRVCESLDNLGDRLERRLDLERVSREASTREAKDELSRKIESLRRAS